MTAFRAPLALLLCLTSVPAAAQQPPPDTSSSAGRLEVSPARLELAVGDSLQLSAKAFDTTGKALPDATIFFKKQGLAAATVDSTGVVRTGGIGDLRVLVTALVPGGRPILRIVEVNVLPSAAKRIEIGSHAARMVKGQRVPLAATVYSAEGDQRYDSVRWTSSAPAATTSSASSH